MKKLIVSILTLIFLLAPVFSADNAADKVVDKADSFDQVYNGLALDSLGIAFEPLVTTWNVLIAEPVALLVELAVQQTTTSFDEGPTAIQYGMAMIYLMMIYMVLTLTPDVMMTAPFSPILVFVLIFGFMIYTSPGFALMVSSIFSTSLVPGGWDFGMGLVIIVVATLIGTLAAGVYGFFAGLLGSLLVVGLGDLALRFLVIPLLIAFAFIDTLVQTFFGQALTTDFIVLFVFPLALTYSLITGLISSLNIFEERTVTLLGLLTFVLFAKTGYNPIVDFFGGLLMALGLISSGSASIWSNPLMMVLNILLVSLAFMGVSMLLIISVALEQKEISDEIKRAEDAKAKQQYLNQLYQGAVAGGWTPPSS